MTKPYLHNPPRLRENYGACCFCGALPGQESANPISHVVLVATVAPLPGTGWGCSVCGLPANGALAVLCVDCTVAYTFGLLLPRRLVLGPLGSRLRTVLEPTHLRTRSFEHDLRQHWAWMHTHHGLNFPPDYRDN